MFAVALYGAPKAVEYIRRYYDDHTDPDPRLEAWCPSRI